MLRLIGLTSAFLATCWSLECSDLPLRDGSAWTDSSPQRASCADFAANSDPIVRRRAWARRRWCPTYGWQNANQGLTASAACCACGGGILLCPVPTTARYRAEDRALRELYAVTDGTKWRAQTYWLNSNVSHCNWAGVTCQSCTEQTVVELKKGTDGYLAGIIPASLQALTSLTILNLNSGFNYISGTLPEELGSLTALRTLVVKGIQKKNKELSGSIPASLVGVPLLTKLVLTGNALSGTLSDQPGMNGGSNPLLANEDVYIWLQISLNWISGTVPRWLSTLTALYTLELGSNRLSGSLWDFNPHQNLSRAAVGQNMFTGTLPLVSKRNLWLQYYDTEANLLSGTLSSELFGLTTLRWLAVGLNSLSGSLEVPSKLDAGLTKLALSSSGSAVSGVYIKETQSGRDVLIGGENRFSGTLSDAIGSLSALQTFILKRARLSGVVPKSLFNLRHLKLVTLYGTRMSGVLPNRIESLVSLSTLDLTGTGLSGAIPPGAALLTALWYFSITTTRMSGSVPHIGGDLLQEIYLSDSEVSGSIPSPLPLSLLLFDSTKTWLSGTIPESLYNATSLRGLFLGSAVISGTLSERMTAMTAIRKGMVVSENCISGTVVSGPMNSASIALDHNYFSGSLPPATLGRSQEWLLMGKFADNHFSGSLPELGSKVYSLSLWRNRISGSLVDIPGGFQEFSVHANALSGSVGSNWTTEHKLLSFFVGSNSISGAIPREISSVSIMAKLFLNNNRISGSISSHLGLLTDVGKLFLSRNLLSGSIPSSLGAMSFLMYLDLGANRLSGSSSPSFGSWPLTFFSIMKNSRLDWDLGLLSAWASTTNTSQKLSALLDSTNPVWLERRGQYGPNGVYSIEHALMSRSGIKGSIPSTMLTGAEDLKSLFLSVNHLSGTMSDQLFFDSAKTLETLDLSNNPKLSGSLPSSVAKCEKLTTFLANNLRISGTMTGWGNHRRSSSAMVALSLARGYLRGSMDNLAAMPNLTTLILSGNYFTCHVAPLESATGLGAGTFKEPTAQRLESIGKEISTASPYVNPYTYLGDPRVYRNICLVFAGNVELTAHAAALNSEPTSRLLQEDRIKQVLFLLIANHKPNPDTNPDTNGEKSHFPGYSTFIQTAAVVFPFLVVLYLLTVCIVLRTHGNPLRSYVCPTVETTQRDARVRALYDRRFPQALFFICGIILTILNATTPGLYDGYCSDPLLRASAGQSMFAESLTEQYMFAFFTWCIFLISAGMSIHMARIDYGASARQVHRTLLWLAARASPQHAAIRNWHERSIGNIVDHKEKAHSGGWRPILFWVFHLPVALFTSLPAIAYVLSENVPKGSHVVYVIFGNPLVVAGFKVGLNSLLVPRIAHVLARFRFAIHGQNALVGSEAVLRLFKAEVASMLLLNVVAVVVAPMGLFEALPGVCSGAAKIAQSVGYSTASFCILGLDAYRLGFCSRRLISEFGYVWISMMLMYVFVSPSMRLIKVQPKFQSLKRRLLSPFDRFTTNPEPDVYAECLKHVQGVQSELVGIFSLTLIAITFGMLVPPLLLLLPIGYWTNISALQWVEHFNWLNETNASFGEALAFEILVQQPLGAFRIFTTVLMGIVMLCIFVDYQFAIGPVVMYIILCVLVIGAQCWYQWHLSRQKHARSSVDEQDIDPETDHNPVEIYNNPVALHKKPDSDPQPWKVNRFFRGVRDYSEANVAARTKFSSRVARNKEDAEPVTGKEPGILSDSSQGNDIKPQLVDAMVRNQLAKVESSDLQQKLVNVLVKRGTKIEKRMQQAPSSNKTPDKKPQVPETSKVHEADPDGILDI